MTRVEELCRETARLRAQCRWPEAARAAEAALAAGAGEAWLRGFGYEERRRLGGDLGAEWKAFEALRRARPQDAAAHILAALASHAAGRWDEGRAALARAARLAPQSARYAKAWSAKLRCWQAETALRRGETTAAFAAFEDAARESGGASWVLAWQAEAALWAGRYVEAEALLARALPGKDWTLGSRAWALGWKGLVLLKSGNARGAARAFEQALGLDPADSEALAGAAEAALALGRRAAALRLARRLGAAAPDSPWPGVVAALAGGDADAGWALVRDKSPRFADYCEERAGTRPEAAARAAFTLAAGNRGPRPTAVQNGARPGDPVRLIELSGRVESEPWWQAARAAAFRVDPARGWIYAWSDAPLADAPGHARLAAALAAASRRSGARAEVWAWRGELTRKLGRAREAMAYLDRALALDPAYSPARAWRGEALRDLSRVREARAELAKASAALAEPWVLALEARLWSDFTPAHLERSLEIYSRALALAPRSAWIRGWRGEALRRLRRLDEAAAELTWAAENGAPVAWAVTALAEVERKRENFARSAELLDFAARSDASWPWVHVTRSELARKRRRYEEAIAHLRRAVEASGRAPWSLALLGRAQAVYRYKKEGLANLAAALRKDPLMGWAWGWRGEIHRRLGRFAAARRDLDRSLALDPDYPWSWAWRGGVRRLMGDAAGAQADLDEAITLQEHYPWAFGERSRARRSLGDIPGAMDDLVQAVRRDQKYRWVEHPTQAAAARAALEKRLAAHPRDGRAWAWLGQTLADAGDAAGAERALRRAVALLGRGEMRGWARAWLGEAILKRGGAAAALPVLSAASREAPGYSPAHAWRGGALALLGRREEAEEALSRAVALDPRSAWTWAWRAELRAARGDKAAARADLDEALNLDPHYADARRLAESL